jgi:hypothetical protein
MLPWRNAIHIMVLAILTQTGNPYCRKRSRNSAISTPCVQDWSTMNGIALIHSRLYNTSMASCFLAASSPELSTKWRGAISANLQTSTTSPGWHTLVGRETGWSRDIYYFAVITQFPVFQVKTIHLS